ncbi:hypothetical protein MNBD_ALPHA04-1146 [hydrothermal vent metagenome]|uniref:CENP-V/GFA domain-containing protein n=1 Tax=hydrothermal vent metagenome TaxID=652676 RepID=A0A3B0S015_9ZZZZ
MLNSKNLNAQCHCGNVKIDVSRQPDFIQDCNCSLCAKSGGIWGYFEPADVKVDGRTGSYTRKDYPQPAVEIRFCKFCGSTTHWILTADHIARTGQDDKMGVNMRLFDSADLDGIELRFPDGKNWFGETEFGFRRKAVILGKNYVL